MIDWNRQFLLNVLMLDSSEINILSQFVVHLKAEEGKPHCLCHFLMRWTDDVAQLTFEKQKGQRGADLERESLKNVIQEFMTHLKPSAVSRFPDSDQVESKWKVCWRHKWQNSSFVGTGLFGLCLLGPIGPERKNGPLPHYIHHVCCISYRRYKGVWSVNVLKTSHEFDCCIVCLIQNQVGYRGVGLHVKPI